MIVPKEIHWRRCMPIPCVWNTQDVPNPLVADKGKIFRSDTPSCSDDSLISYSHHAKPVTPKFIQARATIDVLKQAVSIYFHTHKDLEETHVFPHRKRNKGKKMEIRKKRVIIICRWCDLHFVWRHVWIAHELLVIVSGALCSNRGPDRSNW